MSLLQTVKTTDTDSRNVDSNRSHVNGETANAAPEEIDNKQISDIVDDIVNSAEVSISGGSDNEAASKIEASKLKDDDKGHSRTSSAVKKPASFKAINVNKTFLTTKGTTPSVPAKPTDKPTVAPAYTPSSSASTPRPRLVVKSGSGLVAKSSSGANGGKAGSAPDANAVWNKNRRELPQPWTHCNFS